MALKSFQMNLPILTSHCLAHHFLSFQLSKVTIPSAFSTAHPRWWNQERKGNILAFSFCCFTYVYENQQPLCHSRRPLRCLLSINLTIPTSLVVTMHLFSSEAARAPACLLFIPLRRAVGCLRDLPRS